MWTAQGWNNGTEEAFPVGFFSGVKICECVFFFFFFLTDLCDLCGLNKVCINKKLQLYICSSSLTKVAASSWVKRHLEKKILHLQIEFRDIIRKWLHWTQAVYVFFVLITM